MLSSSGSVLAETVNIKNVDLFKRNVRITKVSVGIEGINGLAYEVQESYNLQFFGIKLQCNDLTILNTQTLQSSASIPIFKSVRARKALATDLILECKRLIELDVDFVFTDALVIDVYADFRENLAGDEYDCYVTIEYEELSKHEMFSR